MTETVRLSGAVDHRAGDGSAGTATPAAGRSRLLGVDAARGVALVGMVAVQSLYESDALGRPSWSFTIFAGRASALFAVLAGIGVAFITHRQRVRPSAGPGAVATLATRALVIGAIGLALGDADASVASVVLPTFAVLFLVAIPLVFLPTWLVAFVGVVVTAGAAVLQQILVPRLPQPALANPGFGELFSDPRGVLTELSLTGPFPAVAWLAYLCAGLVIGRLSLSRRLVILVLLGTGMVLAAAAPVASHLLLHRYQGWQQIWAARPGSGLTAAETTELLTLGGSGSTPTSTWWWLAVDKPHTGTPLDLLGTTGSAIAVLAIMLLASRATRLRRAISVLLVPLAAAGSMTLTIYTLHIIFINSELDTFGPVEGYTWQILAMVLLATAWWATAGRGPLEGLAAVLSRRAGGLADRTARVVLHGAARVYVTAADAVRKAARGERIEPVNSRGET